MTVPVEVVRPAVVVVPFVERVVVKDLVMVLVVVVPFPYRVVVVVLPLQLPTVAGVASTSLLCLNLFRTVNLSNNDE